MLLVMGCGLPGGGTARPVDPASVPYRLLDDEPWSQPGQTEGPLPTDAPVVFWLTADDMLAPASSDASCTDPTEQVVANLLSVLTASPEDGARAAGRSSAVPQSSRLVLLGVADGVAVVGLEASTSLAADRLPLAVGQLVLTVTSAPGIDAVRVSTAGDLVEVPLPGGALTSRPVTRDDYAALVPRRYLARGRPDRVSDEIGCPAARGER
jgi:spore germination protein GerM